MRLAQPNHCVLKNSAQNYKKINNIPIMSHIFNEQ
jgi:hypothetical protein